MVATVANSYRHQHDKGVMDDMDDMEDQPVVMELPQDMEALPQDDAEERPEQDEHSLGRLTKETTADPEMERKRREWARLSARQALEAEEAALRAQQFRRATTVAVPLTAMKRQVTAEEDRQTDDDESDVASPASVVPALPRSKSWSCPRRAAAVEAIERRQVRFRFSTAASARESVREMHQLRFREFPIEACVVAPRVRVQVAGGVWRSMAAELGRDGFYCHRTSTFRKATKGFRVGYDDLIGASIKEHSKHNQLVLHYMRPGRGDKSRRLMRQYATLELRFESRKELDEWRGAVQVLVKWAARVPMDATRRVKVVVNPHSGKRRGRQVWRKWAPLLALAGIECDVEETTYGGHARDLGAAFDPSQKYEALVFVGGDGTVNEFMNGVFSRPEAEWRHLVATTPISLLCAGTDNAFGSGVGIPTHEAAVFCIIKRKIRPLDVMAVEGQSEDGSTRREFSCTGISWGVGSDIALESEATRWLGVHRYKYLKVKRGVLAPRKHVARVQYVLSDSVATDEATGEQVLRTFDELRDRDADDQHHIELCSVYDESEEEAAKQWQGDARAILHPASEDAYAGQWREEENQFTTFGASNVYFEAKYSHPSDGNLDMIFSRKGGFRQTMDLLLRYAAGDMLRAELVGYYKVKALVIDPVSDTPLNVDGEVFPLPGPFRIEVVPQLLCVLSEK